MDDILLGGIIGGLSCERPKMLCKEICEMNFPEICTVACRYTCGHSEDVAHMCEQCFQWWQFLPPTPPTFLGGKEDYNKRKLTDAGAV